MKYISFAIPCYNSQEYMAKAIESILVGGEDVEIIIVNDGSKDQTSTIAHEYQEKYPEIVKVVDKENGGHGDAVNAGLSHASGRYFKVVDSDDWVDEEALCAILDLLHQFEEQGTQIDMLISNYVYEKTGASRKKCIHYRNVLPQGEVFKWDDIGRFHLDQYILMHSVIYRTEMLKLSQMVLPKHTFYVDNIYVYYPLPYVRKIYYLDVDFYRYFIGRDDQSVNEKNMIARVDQQIFVTKSMIKMYQMKDISSKKLRSYMINYLAIMMTVSSIICILPYVRKIYYLDVDFYRYFIGRDDQSVNEKNMIARVDQQIFVTKSMIKMYQMKDISSKKLRSYMINYLAIMMTVSSIICIRSKKEENLEKKKELWKYLKKKDMRTFLKIRYGILGQTMNIPGRSGRKISSLAYSVARRIVGFN